MTATKAKQSTKANIRERDIYLITKKGRPCGFELIGTNKTIDTSEWKEVTYLSLGILNDYYSFEKDWDTGNFTLNGLKPAIPGQANYLTGDRLLINWQSKAYIFEGENYQIGGFTIV